MTDNKDLRLEKSASEDVEDKVKDVTQSEAKEEPQDTPDIPWEEAKKDLELSPGMIAFLPPKKTESGIILPEGTSKVNEKEYRPKARLIADDVEFVEEGDRMILHKQAESQLIPIQFQGHRIFLIREEFVMAKEKTND